MDDVDQFTAFISAHLTERPDHLGAALEAISRGMRGALEQANTRAALKDRAMLAAMTLATPARLTPQMKQTFHQIIADAVDPKNASIIEREFMAKARGGA